jgi:geranylgeranyl pyrophosphate synthase
MYSCFQNYAASLKPSLDAAFSSQLTQLLGHCAPRHPESLQGLTGGKKIRGALLCLVAATLGGSLEDALPRAVAVELIQTATLIHDDFVDGHRSRRGRPSLWTLEDPRRAVLLGDVIFSSAIYLMSELGRQDCRIVSRVIARLARGAWYEPLDCAALLREIDAGPGGTAGYEKIIALKTGVLFAAACELGALAAGIDQAGQQRWQRYGLRIGEAYQVADDLQEMDQVLGKGELVAEELAGLAPALSHFAPGSRLALRRALHRQGAVLSDELQSHIRQAAGLMRADRQRRLRGAVAELDGMVPDGPLMRLARRTPQDLIGMFDGAVSPAAEGVG